MRTRMRCAIRTARSAGCCREVLLEPHLAFAGRRNALDDKLRRGVTYAQPVAGATRGQYSTRGRRAHRSEHWVPECMTPPEVVLSEQTLPRTRSTDGARGRPVTCPFCRVFLFELQTERCPFAARNRAIRACTGNTTCLLAGKNRETGATGLEPATSGVTGHFQDRDMTDGGHQIALFMWFLVSRSYRRRMVERSDFRRLLPDCCPTACPAQGDGDTAACCAFLAYGMRRGG
jgi:hypothetical protein